jgi:PAS domain S-box-containing protein
MVAFGVVLVIVGASIGLTDQQIGQINGDVQRAGNIQTGVSNLAYIANDYLQSRKEASLTLWQQQFSNVTSDIAQLHSGSPKQTEQAGNLADDLQRLNTVFDEAVSYITSIPQNESGIVHPLLKTHSTRLAVQNQALSFDSSVLSSTLENQANQLRQTNNSLIVILLGAFGAYFVIIYLIAFRRTFDSIARLQKSTKIVGSGNLDHSVVIEGSNEISDLSMDFNQMTANLKTATASKAELEKEIAEREKAEEELAKSEKKYRRLYETSQDGIIARNPQGYMIDCNQAYARMVGYSREELSGLTWQQVLPEKWHEQRKIIANEILEKGGSIIFEREYKRKDGSVFPASVRTWRLTDEKGFAIGTWSIVRDVTELKKSEEALQLAQVKLQEYATGLEQLVEKRTSQVTKERKRLYDVLETLPAMVCLLTPDHHVTFANRSFKEKFGESEGRHCYDYCFGNKEPCSFCESYKPFETGQPHHWEVKAPDGSIIDAYDFPFTDTDGSPLILEMDVDITENRRVEEQLRASSAYARNLIEASLDPLVTINAEGKVTDVNRATERVTGFSREELVGSDFSGYFTEPEKAAAGYKQVFTKGFVTDYPLTIKHKSGRITEVLYNAVVYRNAAGDIQGVFAAARDITERKDLERQLKDSERLATIGATAGMVGHDIRNPLQGITSDVYLLRSELESLRKSKAKSNMMESVDGIDQNVQYVNKIVQDLQDFARPLKPAIQEVVLEDLCENVLFKNVLPENIDASCQVDKNVNKIFTDPELLKRILSNLVNNAIQAMPKGGKIAVNAYSEGEDAVISIQDTGSGIPKDVKPKVFTPLFTTKSKGQGFGLAVVKRVTESLGGTVSFESEVGKGTKFIVRLPQADRRQV